MASLTLGIAAFALLPVQHTPLLWAVLAWGVVFVPVLAYVLYVGLTRLPFLASWPRTVAPGRIQARVRGTLFVEAVVGGSAQYVVLLAVASLVSREEAGALRLAVALLGPVSVLFNVVRLYGVAELRRTPAVAGMKLAIYIGLTCVLVAALAGLTLLALPESLARQLLGPSWENAQDLIGWAAADRAAIGIGLGFGVVLRARHVLGRPLRLRMVTSPLSAVAGCAGAAVAGASGAFLGLCFAELVQAAGLYWIARGET